MGDSVIRHLRFEFMLRCFRTHHRNEHVDQRRFLSQLGQLVQWAAIFKVTVEEQAEAIAEPLRFIQSMKTEHRHLPAGADIIHPGQEDAELYTLFSGWAFRYQLLPDGRRQILNFLLPGDLVGLQASLLSAAQHGIEALTEVELIRTR